MQVDPHDLSCSLSTTSSTIVDAEHDHEGYTLVQRRKRLRGSVTSGDSEQPDLSLSEHGLTVIVKPKDGGQLISKINPLKLHEKLDSIYPDGITSVRPNHRLNLLALDTRNTEATKAFLGLTCIGKVSVQTYEPRSTESSVGIIRGVSTDISDADLQTAIRGTVPAKHVRRLGTSDVIKLVFTTSAPPVHVKIGYTRFPVLPYIERPPKCSKCCRFGHIDTACTNTVRCSRCGTAHDGNPCEVEKPRCPNCKQSHESSSFHCPVYRREQAIYQHKSKYRTDYMTAKAAVLSEKLPTTMIAPSTFVARAKEDLVRSHVSADLSSTVEFPRLVTQCTPQSQNTQPSTSNPAPARGSSDHTSGKKRHTANSEHVETASTPTLGATIRKLLDIIRGLLAPLTSPFAVTVTSLIDTVLPFFSLL